MCTMHVVSPRTAEYAPPFVTSARKQVVCQTCGKKCADADAFLRHSRTEHSVPEDRWVFGGISARERDERRMRVERSMHDMTLAHFQGVLRRIVE